MIILYPFLLQLDAELAADIPAEKLDSEDVCFFISVCLVERPGKEAKVKTKLVTL